MKSTHAFTVSDATVRAQIRVYVTLQFEDASYGDPTASFDLEFPTLAVQLLKQVVDLKKLPEIAIQGAMENLKQATAEHNKWVLSIQDNGAQEAAIKAQEIINQQDYRNYPENKTETIGETGWAVRLFKVDNTKSAELISLDESNPVVIPLKPY